MAQDKELSVAIERYDRHFPFFDGTVKAPDGYKLKVFQVGQSRAARRRRSPRTHAS